MLLKCCYTLDIADPSRGVLGLSKVVLYGFEGQRPPKLQNLKVRMDQESSPGLPMTIFCRLNSIIFMIALDLSRQIFLIVNFDAV